MYSLFNKNSVSISNLSWEKSSRFVYVMQKRLFKAVYAGDLLLSFSLQKLILRSSSARLVSIIAGRYGHSCDCPPTGGTRERRLRARDRGFRMSKS